MIVAVLYTKLVFIVAFRNRVDCPNQQPVAIILHCHTFFYYLMNTLFFKNNIIFC